MAGPHAQIAHHLADSEATAYIRLRRLIAEDDPTITGYDEEEFARRLHYDRPIEPSLAVLAGVRAASLQLLESLTDAEWQRTGTHSDSGAYSVDDWLRTYARPLRTTTPTRSAAPAAARGRIRRTGGGHGNRDPASATSVTVARATRWANGETDPLPCGRGCAQEGAACAVTHSRSSPSRLRS